MKKFITGALVALALAGCNSSKNVVYMQDVEVGKSVAVQPYNKIKVRPGDMLSITVSSKEPALAAMFNPIENTGNNTSAGGRIGSAQGSSMIGTRANSGNNGVMPYTVNSNGDIDFPVLGMLHVTGMTREEIANLIKQRIIAGKYIEDPLVNVTFMNLHYIVIGDVSSPGSYSITDDKVTLLDAIAAAGDLAITGKRDAIYVTRTEEGRRTTHKIDLRNSDFYNSPVYYIQQDDVIYVEPNGVKAGQSAINENSFKSVSMWMSIASFLMATSVFIFK